MFKQLNINNATIAILAIVALFLFNCKREVAEVVKSFDERTEVPSQVADSISTIVSDSGIVRYRVVADKWLVYDKANEPYWHFPNGIRFEQFNPDYTINAEIECDSAIYFTDIEQWHLMQNVRAMNMQGERFYTEDMWWYQKQEIVKSDTIITIIQTDKRIIGHGFTSNQDFTKYTIRKPQGTFPLDEN